MRSILLLLSVLFSMCFAKADEVTYVYSNMPKSLEMVSVERNDTSTSIHFNYHLVPGMSVSLPPSYYLSDEKGCKYPLTRCDGFRLGEDNLCPISESIDFTLVFPPLPSSVRFFDLLSLGGSDFSYSMWGIHSSMIQDAFLDDIDCRQVYNDSVVLQSGYVHVKGRVASGKQLPDSMPVSINVYPYSYDAPVVSETHLADDGSFELDVKIEGTIWTFLELGRGKYVPVFLTPDDTLDVTIDNFSQIGERYSYISAKGRVTMSSLLNSELFYSAWDLYSLDALRPSLYTDTLSLFLEKYERLSQYMTWKNKLNPVEAHLLYVSFQTALFENLLTRLVSMMNKLYPPKTVDWHRTDEWKALLLSAEMKRVYSFLEKIDFSDYSYFVVPYRSVVRRLRVDPILCKASLAGLDRFDVLEEYSHQKIDNCWRKRIDPLN